MFSLTLAWLSRYLLIGRFTFLCFRVWICGWFCILDLRVCCLVCLNLSTSVEVLGCGAGVCLLVVSAGCLGGCTMIWLACVVWGWIASFVWVVLLCICFGLL